MTAAVETSPFGGLPPHDIGAEQAVIAALMLDEGAIHRVMPLLDPADFFRDVNRWAYSAAIELAEKGIDITFITLAAAILDRRQDDGDQVLEYLSELPGRYFTAVGIEAHARLIASHAHMRRLIQALGESAAIAYRGTFEPERTQERVEERVRLAGGRNQRGLDHETIEDVVRRLQEPGGGARELVTTGLRPLDRMLGGGFGLGDLICIGAYTSHGKTAIAANMALQQALAGVGVGYIAVEGSPDKITERMAGVLAGMTRSRGEREGWLGVDRREYEAALETLALLPVAFPKRERAPRAFTSIAAWITSQARSEGRKVFYVDHIDDVELESEPGQSMAGAYHVGLRRLQNVAARENVAIVFLSQVSRGSRDAETSMPVMRQLRESGAKEELSQLVLMLWLDYRPDQEQEAARRVGAPGRFLWVKVEKHTEGEIGWVWGPDVGENRPPFVLNLDSMAVVPTPTERAMRAAAQPAMQLG